VKYIIKIICPVQHKLHYFTFIDNVELYYKLISIYKSNDTEFFLDDEKYILSSKKGITNRKGEDNKYYTNFEYTIQMKSRDKLKKLYIVFKPELENSYYGLSKKYGDYQPYNNRKGYGVEVEINTTYFELEDTQIVLKQIFEHFKISKFWHYQNKDKGIIRQCEYHIRYIEKKEQEVANVLKKIDSIVGLPIDEFSKVTRIKESNKYKLYSIRSNKFDELGFYNNNSQWRFGIKTYRVKDDTGLSEYDSIRNPKLEIYMDEQKKEEYLKLSYPRLEDFNKLKYSMFDILTHIIKWSNIEHDHFVSDNYFDSEKEIDFEFIEKSQMEYKLKQLVECVKPGIRKEASKLDSVRDYLNHLIINGQATYESLIESTGLGYDWIRKLTDKLEEKEIITRIKSNVNMIVFKNKYVEDVTRAIVKVMDFAYDEDGERDKRKEDRIESRNRRKRHVYDRWELNEKVINMLIEEKVIPKRNGGMYEVVNYEIIENNQPSIESGG
jgi:DNA-binding Lrp family transcriptional regulator